MITLGQAYLAMTILLNHVLIYLIMLPEKKIFDYPRWVQALRLLSTPFVDHASIKVLPWDSQIEMLDVMGLMMTQCLQLQGLLKKYDNEHALVLLTAAEQFYQQPSFLIKETHLLFVSQVFEYWTNAHVTKIIQWTQLFVLMGNIQSLDITWMTITGQLILFESMNGALKRFFSVMERSGFMDHLRTCAFYRLALDGLWARHKNGPMESMVWKAVLNVI